MSRHSRLRRPLGWRPPSLLSAVTLWSTIRCFTLLGWLSPTAPFSISRWETGCHSLLSLLQSSIKSKTKEIVFPTNSSKLGQTVFQITYPRCQWAPWRVNCGHEEERTDLDADCASQYLPPQGTSHLCSGCRGKTDLASPVRPSPGGKQTQKATGTILLVKASEGGRPALRFWARAAEKQSVALESEDPASRLCQGISHQWGATSFTALGYKVINECCM